MDSVVCQSPISSSLHSVDLMSRQAGSVTLALVLSILPAGVCFGNSWVSEVPHHEVV